MNALLRLCYRRGFFVYLLNDKMFDFAYEYNFQFFFAAKKVGLKGKARTIIWIHSLREKAIAIESMLHKLQSLTIALKRKQQLGIANNTHCSAVAIAASVVAATNMSNKPNTNTTTSFSSSMESTSASTSKR